MDKKETKIPYENLKNLITKERLKFSALNVGFSSSMGIVANFLTSLVSLWFFGTILYMIGIVLPKSLLDEKPADIHYISHDVVVETAKMAQYTGPILKVVLFVFAIVFLIHMFPKKNLARQLFAGTIDACLIGVSGIVCFMPLTYGPTIATFGPVSSSIITVFGLMMVISRFIKQKNNVWNILYPDKEAKKVKVQPWMFLIMGIALTLLNNYVFKLGYNGAEINKYSKWYGWALLIWWLMLDFGVLNMYKQIIMTYYFRKYEERFRVDLHYKDGIWYGPRKAKKIRKKTQQEKQEETNNKTLK